MSRGCGQRPEPTPSRNHGERVAISAPVAPLPAPAAPARPSVPAAGPRFRYVGPARLQVVGPRSGRPYRFDGYGDELDVDSRDAPFFTAIPRLVRIRP